MANTKIEVTRKSGIIHSLIIHTDRGTNLASGTTDAKVNAEIAPDTTVYVTVVGAAGATYEVKVDLPGKANDFTITFRLTDNAQTIYFTIP